MKNTQLLKGFTLVEILMVIALMGILTVTSLTVMDQVSSDLAFDKTYAKMNRIKTALIGDLDANKQGLRDYYGYLGDIGSLPTSAQGLQALLTRPSATSVWAINSTSRTGMGWRGPYLPSTTGVDWLKDSWGNSFVYNTTGTPYILSYGSDGAAGGSGTAADIQIDLGTNITFSTVYGILNENGERYTGNATVEFYYPNGSGALSTSTTSVTSGNNGYFTFSNIPFGLRSLKVTFANGDIIGPVIVSIDNSKFVIPHNYLDATPGALPHTCANTSRVTLVDGSKDESPTTNRIYFELNITESLSLNTIYLQIDNGAMFRGMRIGNDRHYCDGNSSVKTGFTCMDYDILGLGIFGGEDTSSGDGFDTDPNNFPEINAYDNTVSNTPWVIPAGNNIGAYIELSSISGLSRIDLRLGCDNLRIE